MTQPPDSTPAPTARPPAPGAGLVRAIAAVKLLKALLLVLAGIGALRLLHRDLEELIYVWIDRLRVDPDNRYAHAVISRLVLVDDAKLRLLGVGTFLYAALFLIEGVGLLRDKRWAEWLTVVSTSLFVPLEIYELYRRLSLVRATVWLLNLAIVAYLIYRIRRTRTR